MENICKNKMYRKSLGKVGKEESENKLEKNRDG